MEIAPKSRSDQQKKDLHRYNNTLQRIGKKIVEDVLQKFEYLGKKGRDEAKMKRSQVDRKRKERASKNDEEK